MAEIRGEFSSRFGFVMAASGSAVGLGNIWGFPTQAASNGGAAFLLVYLVLAFTLAYPALMAELIIGRHAHANAVSVRFLDKIGNDIMTENQPQIDGHIGPGHPRPHEIDRHVGMRIRQRRVLLGLTQLQLSETVSLAMHGTTAKLGQWFWIGDF